MRYSALQRTDESQKIKRQQQKYSKINKTIKQQCRQAKESWITAECQEAKRMHAIHDSVNFYRKIKKITSVTKKTSIH